MARPPQLTPVVQDAIVRAVRRGISVTRAGLLLGFDESTINMWIDRGEGRRPDRPPEPRYVEFVRAVRQAWAEDEYRRIKRIDSAGRGGAITHKRTITKADGSVVEEVRRTQPSWQADAWHLERTRRDAYAPHTTRDVSHTLSPALEALTQQWQLATQEASRTPIIEATYTPLPLPPTDAATAHTYALLDRLNGTPEPEEEDA
jgi:hypothetical protein